jgi:hypothetical protein
MIAMDASFDASMLTDAFASCACCVRESLDAAGVSLDCRSLPLDEATDAWHSS